jgi:plastocyanin
MIVAACESSQAASVCLPPDSRSVDLMKVIARRSLLLAAIITLAATTARPARAQSLLERTPNVSGGWVGGPHNLHFNFVHRFNNSGKPERKVTNRPTFTLAYGLPIGLLAGVQYVTSSDIVANYPNEWEPFARYALLVEDRGHPVDLAATAAYNTSAESVDGELSVARRIGPFRLLASGRAFSAGYAADARYAVAAGATIRLNRWLAVAGDYGTLIDRLPGESRPWGVGVQLGIPLTPHSISLYATNTNSATLQGAARGGEEKRWGFEFTVPVALRRYFGSRQPPVPVPVAAADEDSLSLHSLRDSVRAELEAEYQLRWRADSLRLMLRDDSTRLRQQLADVRAQARADSARAAAARVAREPAAREPQRQDPARPPVRVNIRNLAYAPATLQIEPGTTVVWRNQDQVDHTVTAANRSFDSGLIRPGASWQRTFTTPGTFSYYCTPHPFMRGTITVRSK